MPHNSTVTDSFLSRILKEENNFSEEKKRKYKCSKAILPKIIYKYIYIYPERDSLDRSLIWIEILLKAVTTK